MVRNLKGREGWDIALVVMRSEDMSREWGDLVSVGGKEIQRMGLLKL